jgi:2-iminoacetate synthase
MTLQEYLEDYAAPDTKTIGENLIIHEMENVSNPKVKEIAKNNLENIKNGKRDFRF